MSRSSRISKKEFGELVEEALSQVPEPFQRLLENIVVVVEEEPDDEEILGIYRGAMMTERSFNDLPSLPAQVAIFRGPILRCTTTRVPTCTSTYTSLPSNNAFGHTRPI